MTPRGQSFTVSSEHITSSKTERKLHNEKAPLTREFGSLNQLECSMCGDIGLQQELFRCINCRFRLQHTYCSISYPKKRSYAGVCNWCDKDDESVHAPKHTEVFKASAKTESPRAGRWNNELEMLLEAATVALEKERELERFSNSFGTRSGCETKAGSCVNKRPKKMLRARSYPEKTEDGADKTEENNVSKCKITKLQTSTLPKRIGRRYKCILDVY